MYAPCQALGSLGQLHKGQYQAANCPHALAHPPSHNAVCCTDYDLTMNTQSASLCFQQ